MRKPTADGRPRISPLRDESRQNKGGQAPVVFGLTGVYWIGEAVGRR